ncbi:PP2C family protein-serine/threonine phosphatase [Halomicronema sp. CCY15110]|uniref:PP2C family protein-serine/threonine phosphatase n=1 Tax=Halomicronema sp. CCY15110 TaxID=2767773 RepID=UPI00194E1080|nr:SpoIIE family protein phosphatase [Halomicronema sp. CCY15110]
MMHILVVNSDAAVRDRLYQWLDAAEYDLTLWGEDPQALDLKQFSEPLLIIGDWQQATASDCLSTWQGWKAHPDTPPIFCLMLIATDHLDNLVPALAAGADDWLTYPLDEMTLRARLLACQQVLQLRQDLQAQKAQLQTELAEAEAYVRSLLPKDLTQKVPINARFIPSSSLGGDCYDFYWLDPDYLVIYLLDVSGHGLGSALLSTSVLNMLRSQALPDVNFYRPEKVLQALNDTFQMNDQNEKYFTMWYGVYNRANRQLMYASAGHPPAVLISPQLGQQHLVEALKTPGLPIGMLPDVQYSWNRCEIPPGSRLYLFSDGVYEIKQWDNTIMGLEDFIEILSTHNLNQPIDEILTQVNSRTQDRSAFSDDLSLLEVCLD